MTSEEKNENMNEQSNQKEESKQQEASAEEIPQGSNQEKDYKKEYDELYDRYIRLAADFDNYKKRTAKEKSDISAYGNEELIKSILDVVDNLERALTHADTGENNGSLVEGVKLVHSQLMNCLKRYGLEKIDAEKGTEFDPRYHQAFERVETDELSPGMILSEMVKGYRLKDRLLRPAVVSVSVEPVNRNESENSPEVHTSGDDTGSSNGEPANETQSQGFIELTDEDLNEKE